MRRKNVELAGGTIVQAVRVYDTLKKHRGVNFGTVTTLSEEGLAVADEIGSAIAELARQAMAVETEAQDD